MPSEESGCNPTVSTNSLTNLHVRMQLWLGLRGPEAAPFQLLLQVGQVVQDGRRVGGCE